jgi:hypothetical protein
VKIATEHIDAKPIGKAMQRESVNVPTKSVRGTLVMTPEMRKKSFSFKLSL